MKLDRTDECPNCQRQLNAATHTSEEGLKPVVGDFTVCLYCSSVLKFEEEGLSWATAEEIAGSDLVELARAQNIVLKFNSCICPIIRGMPGRQTCPVHQHQFVYANQREADRKYSQDKVHS